jgi:hypothetical protein
MGSTAGIVDAAPTSGQSAPTQYVDPVQANFYINGSPYVGLVDYSVSPGSSVSLNVTATYPWSAYPSLSNSIFVSYAIESFPIPNAMPAWLSVASLPSVTIPNGDDASSELQVTSSKAVENGTQGSFVIEASYTDPVTGTHVVFEMVIKMEILANNASESPSSNSMGTHVADSYRNDVRSHNIVSNVHHREKTWAVGAGLCNSNSTGKCSGGEDVNWADQNGLTENVTIPSFTDSHAASIQLDVRLTSVIYMIQLTITAPSSGSTWEEGFQYWDTQGDMCTSNIATVSAGTTVQMIVYYSGSTAGWEGSFNGDTFAIGDDYCYGHGSPSTTFGGVNQEPFAFESNDNTSGDFSSLLVSVPVVFGVTTDVNCYTGGIYEPFCVTWVTYGAYVVNDPSGGNSWGPYIIGSGIAPPSSLVEAGHYLCSSITGAQVYFGSDTKSPLSSTCGSQAVLTRLI